VADAEPSTAEPGKWTIVQYLSTIGQTIGLASSVSAVIGVFLVYFTLQETKNGNIEANRAWAELKSIDMSYIDSGKSDAALMYFSNSGKEPARDLQISGYADVERFKTLTSAVIPEKHGYCDGLLQKGELFNDNPIETTWVFNNSRDFEHGKFTKESMNAMKSGSAAFVFWGCLKYSTFGQLHTTTYCVYHYFEPSLNRFLTHPCRKGNVVD
jgi:hypothetical protein